MSNNLLHIYRNTPFGREILMQSSYFCRITKRKLKVFIPDSRELLIYFESSVITVKLDKAFLRSKLTARKNAEAIITSGGLKPDFIKLNPEDYTAGAMPNLPTDCEFMCCPRSIRDISTKMRLGYIGSKVRSIINRSTFPILIPSLVFKEWKSITVFFGGSELSLKALKLANRLRIDTGFPLNIFVQAENNELGYYRGLLKDLNLNENKSESDREKNNITWLFFDKGKFINNLFAVPHDSLVVFGAFGHGVVNDLLFGSKLEKAQKTLPNNMLIVGPKN